LEGSRFATTKSPLLSAASVGALRSGASEVKTVIVIVIVIVTVLHRNVK